MTHYDELRKIYARYKTKSAELDLERRSLPAILAESFASFLGCPTAFVEPSTKSHRRYVLPAVVARASSSAGNLNILKPYNPVSDGLPNLELSEDHSFHFGICVFLEFAEQIFPKEPFGILLSAKNMKQSHLFCVRLHISGIEYKVSTKDMDANIPLYESLLEVMKKSLTGVKIEYEAKQGIGFVKFHHLEINES
jgi:hypothetical protein